MTTLTLLHFASPFAYSMPMPRKSLASVHALDDPDRASASGETESGDLSEAHPTSGADRVSLLAGDAALSRSQDASALQHYDAVLRQYRDHDGADAQNHPAQDPPDQAG